MSNTQKSGLKKSDNKQKTDHDERKTQKNALISNSKVKALRDAFAGSALARASKRTSGDDSIRGCYCWKKSWNHLGCIKKPTNNRIHKETTYKFDLVQDCLVWGRDLISCSSYLICRSGPICLLAPKGSTLAPTDRWCAISKDIFCHINFETSSNLENWTDLLNEHETQMFRTPQTKGEFFFFFSSVLPKQSMYRTCSLHFPYKKLLTVGKCIFIYKQ